MDYKKFNYSISIKDDLKFILVGVLLAEPTSNNLSNSSSTSPIVLTICFSLSILLVLWNWKGAVLVKYVKD